MSRDTAVAHHAEHGLAMVQTTVSFKAVSCGTELRVVQEGIPARIPTEACYLGWQECLTLLAQLVEAKIPV